jgi:hypothetical protein
MAQDKMDKTYRNLPLENIPWNIETPPETLVSVHPETLTP